MDILRGLIGIRRMDMDLDERIDERVLRWFGHVERIKIESM